MALHLLIDDVRDVYTDLIARDGETGLDVLRSMSVTHLYLDNDMGEDRLEGWEVLDKAFSENMVPPNVQLVTSNPVARERMKKTLIKNGYTTENNHDFVLQSSE